MGQLIQFGQTVQKIGIDKFDCVGEVKAMLINYQQPYVRCLAFDETNKCSVECTQELALKYGLNPQPYYFFIVASFSEDINKNIIGEKERSITYLRMSNNQYEQFLSLSANLDQWNGLVTINKVKKSVNGRDFSYLEAKPASFNSPIFKGISKPLASRLKELSTDTKMLEASVKLIDIATGLTEDKYIERINKNAQSNGQQQAHPQQVSPTTQAQAIPQQTQVVEQVAPQDVVSVDEVQPTDDLPF